MAGVSEQLQQDVELSRVARDSFHGHRYESCLSALNKLLDSRRYDGRIIHNRAVAQYMLSNLTHTDEFRRTLQSVSAQVTLHIQHTLSVLYMQSIFSLTVKLREVVTLFWSVTKQSSFTIKLSYT